jgi:hypothetical protein
VAGRVGEITARAARPRRPPFVVCTGLSRRGDGNNVGAKTPFGCTRWTDADVQGTGEEANALRNRESLQSEKPVCLCQASCTDALRLAPPSV